MNRYLVKGKCLQMVDMRRIIESVEARDVYTAERYAEATAPKTEAYDARGIRRFVYEVVDLVPELQGLVIEVKHTYGRNPRFMESQCRRREWTNGRVVYTLNIDHRMRSFWTVTHELGHVLQMQRAPREDVLNDAIFHDASFRRAHVEVMTAVDPNMADFLRAAYARMGLKLED